MVQLLKTDVPLSVKIAVAISLGQVFYLLVTTGLGAAVSPEKGATLIIAAFYLLITLFLVGGALALLKGRRFGQPLVLVWQLFAFIIGVRSVVGGQIFFGLAIAILSGVVVLASCSKATVDYVTHEARCRQPVSDNNQSSQ